MHCNKLVFRRPIAAAALLLLPAVVLAMATQPWANPTRPPTESAHVAGSPPAKHVQEDERSEPAISARKTDESSPGSVLLPLASGKIDLCQALGPAAPCPIRGVDGGRCNCGELGWHRMGPIPWQAYAQGEYVGHERKQHVPVYRVRVDDLLEIVYRLTRNETSQPYEFNVGDQLRIESFTDEKLNRDLVVQPDGTVTLHLLGQVRAARRTVEELRQLLEERYKKYYKVPAISVIPVRVNTRLEDLRATVDARAGQGGQRIQVRVTPEGTIQLPALGSIPVQGLSLEEVKREIDERYAATIEGVEVTPVLFARAPRFIYVLGEVANPGRFELEGPTTAMQAIALAGSWNVGANLRQVVVFRRSDDWRLMATMLALQAAPYGKDPNPSDEIWLNDSDIVLVPKNPILWANEFIDQVFTRGIYGVFPMDANISFVKLSTI